MAGYVYKIINIKNGKYYIGSTNNIIDRMNRHFRDLKNGRHHSVHLQRAYDIYGVNSFIFQILCVCEEDKRLSIEQEYLDKIDFSSGMCYNVSRYATNCVLYGDSNGMYGKRGKDNPNYGSKRSIETRQKMSIHSKLRNKTPDMIKKAIETKKRLYKIGILTSPTKGKKMGEETKAKLSQSKSIDIACYTKGTLEFIRVYHGAKYASAQTGVDASSIIRCCKHKVKSAGGMVWEYYDGTTPINIKTE